MSLSTPRELHFEVERLKSHNQSLRLRVTDLEKEVERIKQAYAQIMQDNLPTTPFNEIPEIQITLEEGET